MDKRKAGTQWPPKISDDSKRKYCCERFADAAGHLEPLAGGAGLYPVSMRPTAQFEPDADGTWNINGCCGVGCFVVTGVKFCPFCGAKVP